MEFRAGKVGAFTMVLDDSMLAQADNAIPLLNARQLVATFYVNPGLERYQQRKDTWEVICPRSGQELSNHTWRHQGAKDMREADFEIGESSRHIWKLYPHRSKLLLFARGGGTEWGPSRDEIQALMDKYLLVRRPRDISITDESGNAATITQYPQQALDDGTWVLVLFHGVGGEWLSTNLQAFVNLLDFLVAHREHLWVGGEIAVRKYQQEQQALAEVKLEAATGAGFAIKLTCDPSKVKTSGRPFPELYDEPLTVRVEVPASWCRFQVKQGETVQARAALDIRGRHVAQFDVLPNVAAAVVTRQ
jgi:peptidoglycan/xylan/chitin deacetylase (PgdA/CDA1 family)